MLEKTTHKSSKKTCSVLQSRINEDLQRHTACSMKALGSGAGSRMLRQAPSRWAMSRPPHVCIVGAGVAGLRCTELLLEKGVEVTLIEGRDRVGGRCHQVLQKGRYLDMGPNWIHGTNKNPMVELAKETNTPTSEIGERVLAYNEHGNPFSHSDKPEELHGLFWGIIADAFKYSNDSTSIPASESLKDFFVNQLEQRDLGSVEKMIVMQMAEQWGHFIGSPFEKQSLKYFWLEETIDGENLFMAGTYKAVLDKIASKALQGAHIHFSTRVKSIKSPLQPFKPGEGGTVVSADGFEKPRAFDATILTASLGCLKADQPAIEPALPLRIQHAIRNLSYGNLEKAYITFPEAFWSPTSPESFPTFVNFLHPLYDSNNPTFHIIDVMALSALPGKSAHPTLLFYFSGPYAQKQVKAFAEHPPDSEEYHNAVTGAFEPYYSRLPNYDSNSPSCKPVAAIATAWSVDALAGNGSYANFQIPRSKEDADAKLDEDIIALRKGCPERALWLAGEHTAPFVALGTITGAYWSGEAVAHRVIDWFEGKGDAIEN